LAAVYVAAGRIEVRVEAEDVRFAVDRAVPCGLLLNELLSNAFKHAFPDGRGGQVRIGLRTDGARVRLAVEDTGVGLSAVLDPQHCPTLGMRLVHALVEQLQGRLRIQRQQGTAFLIEFVAY
jgi:two-component sensor histidine kinase